MTLQVSTAVIPLLKGALRRFWMLVMLCSWSWGLLTLFLHSGSTYVYFHSVSSTLSRREEKQGPHNLRYNHLWKSCSWTSAMYPVTACMVHSWMPKAGKTNRVVQFFLKEQRTRERMWNEAIEVVETKTTGIIKVSD